MAEALAFEKADKHGNPVKHCPCRNPWKATKQCIKAADVAASESLDGTADDYEEPKAASSPGSNVSDTLIPSNTEKMKYSLNGLVGSLKLALTPMFCLYVAMKEHVPDDVTQEEIMIASGQKVLDPGESSKFLDELESMNSDIWHAFEKQAETAAGPWDQEMFEDLVMKWIVTTDQPFYTVDELEFCKL
ncbi:hypothetical protein F5148DRAFT_1295675 [Russula earlei]|uniref:Uncharacterized protein n=1 Tax=Russula earlei TaxID=71964 RepID=A0ACC0TQM0_9AGAM|nr:hypothetical protein F5148DRAFT_1295675 [Russula earlei]